MMEKLDIPDHIASIKSYVPGRPIEAIAQAYSLDPAQVLKLASNENPLGPSPGAMAAMSRYAPDVSRYPDNDCTLLTKALADWHEISEEWIVTGAGSESVIGNAVSTLLYSGRKTAYSQYSFQAYGNAVQRVGAEPFIVPSPHLVVDLAGLRDSLSYNPAVVYIANPGNPTGTLLPSEEIYDFLKCVPAHTVVILDEAYLEFVAPDQRGDSVKWVREFPNLLVTRTFSKAYGLAGLRIGYGIAQAALINMLRRVRAPFVDSQLAQIAAQGALGDQEFIEKTVHNNSQSKAILEEGFREMNMSFLPSHTNFLLVNSGNGGKWAEILEQDGIIVRPVTGYGLPQWLRISVGMPKDSVRVIEAMKKLLQRAIAPTNNL